MKSFALRGLGSLMALVAVALAVGNAAASEPGPESEPTSPAANAAPPSDAAQAAAAAPAKQVAPRPRVRAEPPVSYLGGEIVKMAQAGVGTEVLKAFVERATYACPPRAEEVIYLHGRGIHPEVITTLIARAGELQKQAEQAAAANAKPAAQPPPAPPAPAAVPQPPPPAPAPVVVQQPVYVYPPQPVYPSYAYSYRNWSYSYRNWFYVSYPSWYCVRPSVRWWGGVRYHPGLRYTHRLPRQFHAPVGAHPRPGPWAVPGGRSGGRPGPHRR